MRRAALVLGAAALAISSPAGASHWGAEYFPNVPLTTQDGKVVRFYDDLLKDKTVAVNLMYTHCSGSCPLETARMAQVKKLLGDRVGKDIYFYSITIEPDRDTPEVLKSYAARYKIESGSGWLFLTGKMEDIKLIASKLGLSSLTDGSNKDGHLPTLMVGNVSKGMWMKNSAVDNPRFLAATLTTFLDGYKHASTAKSYSEAARAPHLDRAEYLYRSRCSACHSLGKGEGIGPDLADVSRRRDRGWLSRYIAEPERVLADRDPIALDLLARYRDVRMPNLGLDRDEVAALLALLEKSSATTGPKQASAGVR